MATRLSDVRRYELKYTINESMASEIRDYISHICVVDKNVAKGEKGYFVNSLYFDTDDLKFYTDTKHRKLTRYKPRARFYGDKVGKYIWPEIKYRQASIIWKNRYRLAVENWPGLFYPEKSESREAVIKEQLDRFEDLIYWYDAKSILHVRYFREPYVTNLESYGRVTFDRNLSYRSTSGSIDLDFDEKEMIYYDDAVTTRSRESFVLLEIKVETAIPYWVQELIRKFNLMQRPFSKYCYGVDNINEYNSISRNSIFV